jgi:2-methylisocitrate lyase-like PEP mutase family enzyme
MADDRRARFRQLLKDPAPLLMPGGFSPIMARMAQLVGFQTFYMSGSQTAAYVHGLPDVGLVTMRDMVDNARRVASVSEIPVFADADTGYGNAINVYHTVQEYVRAGVSGIHLEDQEAPKKSGTMAGRRCISREEAIGKLKAAVAAKREIDPDFVICARCDVIGAEGGSYEEALERSIAYAEEAEADMVWLNNVQTIQEAEEACRRIPCPVIPHWGGPPPAPSLDDWRNIGAAAMLFPAMTTSVGLQAAWDFLNDFKERGMVAQVEWSERARSGRWGPASKHNADLLRAPRIRDLEDRFLPGELQRDYETTFGHRMSVD